MDFFIPTITIIGLGETGSIIASLVNHGKQNIKINIIDPDENAEGRILDLKHAAIANQNEIYWNNKKLVSESKLVFYTAGVRGKAGASRAENAARNKSIIENVFNAYTFKPSSLIVTISNPVEASALWIHRIVGSRCKVLSTGTLLDTYRLQTILSEHFETSASNIETIVVGEHGTTMFPIWSQTKINGQPIEEIASESELEVFWQTLLDSATIIRKTQAATKYGVAQTAITLANQFYAKQAMLIPLAFHAKSFIGDDLFVNWPCFVGKQHVVPTNIKLDKKEQERWQKALVSIRETTLQTTQN